MIVDLSHLVIFAGGKGSRLGRLGSFCPKAAISINGAPLVSYLIDWARGQGLKKIILAAGHLHEMLLQSLEEHYQISFQVADAKTFFLKLDPTCEILLRDTGQEAQTAERLLAVRDLLGSQKHFVATYADTLTNMSLATALEVAERRNSMICLTAGFPDARYGELLISGDLVTAFREKARPKFRVNRGFLIIKEEIFSRWNRSEFISFELDVLPYFASRSQVAAYKSDDWFFSVDSEVDANELANVLSKL